LKSHQKVGSNVKAVSVNSKMFHALALATGKDGKKVYKLSVRGHTMPSSNEFCEYVSPQCIQLLQDRLKCQMLFVRIMSHNMQQNSLMLRTCPVPPSQHSYATVVTQSHSYNRQVMTIFILTQPLNINNSDNEKNCLTQLV